MESLAEKSKKRDGSSSDSLTDSMSESRISSTNTSKSSSDASSFEANSREFSASSPAPKGWPLPKPPPTKCFKIDEDRPQFKDDESANLRKLGSRVSEMEMMKEKFAKLLLGEDMSGSGRGVCPALAISNALTNLCATVFGQLWRLEPLPSEKKLM